MTHVVNGNCVGCRFSDCVSVCPVSCFHGDAERMYIDPVACIDCGACIPACPVHAIVESIDLTGDELRWLNVNKEGAQRAPVISSKQLPLPTAEARKLALGY